MRILHVLSQFEVTGAEAYAATLASKQVELGHEVFILSDTFTLPTKATYLAAPIGQRSPAMRWQNIRRLEAFIRSHRIDCVHSHSRAASWVSYFAAHRTRTGFVSTIHGRQHRHLSSRAFNIYGNDIIAVCEEIKDALARDLGITGASVIRNCIDCDGVEVRLPGASEEGLVAVLGRLSGPKGDVARFFLKEVAPRLLEAGPLAVTLIRGKHLPPDIAELIANLNRGRAEIVTLAPFEPGLGVHYNRAAVVVGAGRIAIEAIVRGVPVIAFGESGYLGPVRCAEFEAGMRTNFGDVASHHRAATAEEVAFATLRSMANGIPDEERRSLAMRIRAEYDVERIETRIAGVYRRAVARVRFPAVIPVLMYHRVIRDDEPRPRHGIWVTATAFARQMASLHRRGMTTITFCQYDEILKGTRPPVERPVIITFDDGYADTFHAAFPILQRYGATAVVFVVTDPTRRTNCWDPDEPQIPLLTPGQIREMAAKGIEFGSHTHSHADLTALEAGGIHEELHSSKQYLEGILGTRVRSFAYPYGRMTAEVKDAVAAAGYRYAVAADEGPEWLHDDLLAIRRWQVFPWTTPFGFWRKTQQWYYRYRSMKKRRKATSVFPRPLRGAVQSSAASSGSRPAPF